VKARDYGGGVLRVREITEEHNEAWRLFHLMSSRFI